VGLDVLRRSCVVRGAFDDDLRVAFGADIDACAVHYLEIVSAVALGYFVFSDFPNALTWVGIAVIVASGLYIIWRERVTATPPIALRPRVH